MHHYRLLFLTIMIYEGAMGLQGRPGMLGKDGYPGAPVCIPTILGKGITGKDDHVLIIIICHILFNEMQTHLCL